jgi:hypothetical protein
VNALEKLAELYAVKEKTDANIAAIEAVLGGVEAPKQRRKRGPNKPKEVPKLEVVGQT